MKKIEAIVRTDKIEDLKDALLATQVKGMTISQVLGCGNSHGFTEYHRGSEVYMNVLNKVKIEIVCEDSRVEGLVGIIIDNARTGEVGDGKIFIQPVDEVIRIRTGERGSAAI